jgi:hydroxyacylglutathione hydrolase
VEIFRFINTYRQSNTYVVKLNYSNAVLVDVGDVDLNLIIKWLDTQRCKIRYVILTHEHSDHCVGVNGLAEHFDFDLICSSACSNNIKNKRQNLSLYSDEIETFQILMETKIVQDMEVLDLSGYCFQFLETPGHSPGGMCIRVGDFLFSGDTILEGIPSPVNFPHSSKQEYQKSVNKLNTIIQTDLLIYPGHGETFKYFSPKNLIRFNKDIEYGSR